MTPGDILNKTFPRGMNGYKADEVNAFLSEVAAEMKLLAQERTDLQNKLEILAEKLEEYRGDEESLRSALIGAQKLGDSVVKESRKKAETILSEATKKAELLLSEANQQADAITGEAKRNMDAEAYALSKMKLETTKFRTNLLNLYKKQVELINTIPHEEGGLYSPPAVKQPEAAAPIAEKEEPIPVIPAEDPIEEEISLEYERVSGDAGEAFPQHKSRYRNTPLLFGDQYGLKRNE